MRNNRYEIVNLLRGQVACPLITSLAELGWLEKMCEREFRKSDFGDVNREAIDAVFSYLVALGLITGPRQDRGDYSVSDLGRSVFSRYGAFCILSSYKDFFGNVGSLLVPGTSVETPVVNRLLNVRGSGQLHSRKFFPGAIAMLGSEVFPFVVDLGCGDGRFVDVLVEKGVTGRVGGVDISSVAINAASARVRNSRNGVSYHFVRADVSDLESWSQQFQWTGESGLFSLWFVLHEFAKRDPERVLLFLRRLCDRYPNARVLIGEVVRVPEETLARNRSSSIMPEMLLFHDLSGQGVLTWRDWQWIRQEMPYYVSDEELCDSLSIDNGEKLPSSFIWLLEPFTR